MEINVNKEICSYKEAVFFGLTTRQFVCSVAAIGIAVGTYFGLKGILGKETVSWLCMIAALPVAAMGFFKYNSLTAEQLFLGYYKIGNHLCRQACLQSGQLLFISVTYGTDNEKGGILC